VAISAANLIARAQSIAGLGAAYISGFIANARWGYWVDDGVEELYQLMIAADPQLFRQSALFTLAGATNWTDLTALIGTTPSAVLNFRQLLGVTRNPVTPNRQTLHRFNFAERDVQWQKPTYRPMGNLLYIEPMEQAPGDYVVFYGQGCAYPFATAANLDDRMEPWAEYIETFAAIQGLVKEKSDTRALEARLAAIAEALEETANRDAGEPDSITDVEDDGSNPWL
jgi:hypothetical protein